MTPENTRIRDLVCQAAKETKEKFGYYACDWDLYLELNRKIDEATTPEEWRPLEDELESYHTEDYLTIEVELEDCFDQTDDYMNKQPDDLFISFDGLSIENPIGDGECINFEIQKEKLLQLYKKSDEEILKIFKEKFEKELEDFHDTMFDY